MSEQKELGALWIKTSQNGAVYYTGKINNQDVVCFVNRNKTSDKQPELRIYLSEKKEN